MTAIIVAPHVEKAQMQIQGIFTVHREDADLECNCPQRRGGGCGGIEIAAIPLLFRKFELLCSDSAKQFLSRMQARGREWTGSPILLHGPWPSRLAALTDPDSPVWDGMGKRDKADNVEHPERVLEYVQDLQGSYTHMDYVLLADFWIDDTYTDLEV